MMACRPASQELDQRVEIQVLDPRSETAPDASRKRRLMTNVIRFSPSRIAVSYVVLSVVVLSLFAIPLWYMWGVNLSTFRAYVDGKNVDSIVRAFERGG